MADYVSGEEKCGAPAPNGASVCALPPGHENQHRNAWYAPWPASGRCTYIYGPNGNRCAFANGDEQHDHRTSTRLGYVHQDQWRPVQSAEHDRFYRLAALLTDDTAGETWDSLLQRVADLKAELEVERVRANTRKAELDKQDAARLLMGPSAEYGTTPLAARVAELAKDLAALQRKVRAQANHINKLEHETVRRCESWNSGTRCVGYTRHAGAHHGGSGTERWA